MARTPRDRPSGSIRWTSGCCRRNAVSRASHQLLGGGLCCLSLGLPSPSSPSKPLLGVGSVSTESYEKVRSPVRHNRDSRAEQYCPASTSCRHCIRLSCWWIILPLLPPTGQVRSGRVAPFGVREARSQSSELNAQCSRCERHDLFTPDICRVVFCFVFQGHHVGESRPSPEGIEALSASCLCVVVLPRIGS